MATGGARKWRRMNVVPLTSPVKTSSRDEVRDLCKIETFYTETYSADPRTLKFSIAAIIITTNKRQRTKLSFNASAFDI